jgi:hypothetical protein
VIAHSEGGGVEVDGGGVTMTKRLRNRMTVARSEAWVEVAACYWVGDEAVACSEAGIEDNRWQQWCDNF